MNTYAMVCKRCDPPRDFGCFDTLRAAEVAMRAHEHVHHPEQAGQPVFRDNPDGSREQVW